MTGFQGARHVVTVDREALEVVMRGTVPSEATRTSDEAWRELVHASAALRQSLDDAPAPGDVVELDGASVLLDAVGAAIAVTSNAEVAVVLDLGGKLNKHPTRVRHRYLTSPAQAAEVIVALLKAGIHNASADAFQAALDALQAPPEDPSPQEPTPDA